MAASIQFVCFVFLTSLFAANAWVSENRRIEQEILRSYDRRHRPVKKESTVVRVQLYLTINHIERVDELEGTMYLHGILWASWYDEYLRWTPSEHNHTYVISMETWKIWQPTFALYNSARSNSWFVFMNGVPATVSNDGRVFAAGTFSFQVTCQFDFSDYPYDVQECPIVLADWIYDLSKVNLSEAVSTRSGLNSLAKPAIRLSFDPLSENVKRHVAGWEVIDTWQRLCYWGPNGYCVDQNPIGPLDNYWSLIEFGVRIKRHAPYYGLTLVLPILITSALTLMIFWLDNLALAIFLCVFNLLLEFYSGLNLIQELPPGDGILPTIGVVHVWNLSLTLLALCIHCIFHFLLTILPPETKFLPEQLTDFTSILRQYKYFQSEGISFDPQKMMGFESLAENHVGGYQPFDAEAEITDPPVVRPFDPDSLIIEMEPFDTGSAPLMPSTSSSQFEAVKLVERENDGQQQPVGTKKIGSGVALFGGMFGGASKNGRNQQRITIPAGIFSGAEIAGKKEANGESKEKGDDDEGKRRSDDDERRLLLIRNEEERQQEEEGNKGRGGTREGSNNVVDENTKKRTIQKEEEVERQRKSALELELLALRRLLFGFFLLATVILICLLIF